MKQKYNATFRLEHRQEKNSNELIQENVPIILDFTFDNRRLQYFTGYRVDFTNWDNAAQQVKKNNFNRDLISASTINSHLTDIRKHVTDIYKDGHSDNNNKEEIQLYKPLST